MTNEELRIAIAKAKGYEIGYAYELFAEVRLGDPVPEPEKSLMYLYHEKTFSDGSPIWVQLPNWPNDIAAAWELVDDFLAAGCELTLSSESRNDNKVWYVTRFDFRGDGKGTGYTMVGCQYADTAPQAICAAWLAWNEAQ